MGSKLDIVFVATQPDLWTDKFPRCFAGPNPRRFVDTNNMFLSPR